MPGVLQVIGTWLAAGLAASSPATATTPAGDAQPTEPGVRAWPVTPQPGAQPGIPAEINTADDLLLALERTGEDLRTLQAGIRYTKVFALAGDEQIRTGKLYYRDEGAPGIVEPGQPGPAGRAFAVHFETLQLGRGEGARLDREERSYIFDGEWLVEKMPEARQMIKRQVVPPGQRFDPLRVGEGPFPIPIGQKRSEILERFEAELVDAADELELIDPTGALAARVARTPAYQVRLTPRSAYADELKLAEIRLWYRADTLLPFLAWTLTSAEDESIVELIGVKTNEFLPAGVMDTRSPDRGWDVEIREWRGSVEGSP